VIALWLGHVSIETTNVYEQANLAVKERALVKTAPIGTRFRRFRTDGPPVGISGIALSRSISGRETIRPFSLLVEDLTAVAHLIVRFRTLASASGHDHCVARLPIPVSSFAANVLRLESVVWDLLCLLWMFN
jgi:hypothetical protein